jgi:hypothetical protein
MKKRTLAVGLTFCLGLLMSGTTWAQGRGGGRQQSSLDSLWQWTNQQLQQGKNALSQWQGQGNSNSDAVGMDSQTPGANPQPGRVPPAGYSRGSGSMSGNWDSSLGRGASTPNGGMGTMSGRGRGAGQGLAGGRGSGRGRSGQMQQPMPMNQNLPGMSGTATGLGRGPCGQGQGKATSRRGRGGRRR